MSLIIDNIPPIDPSLKTGPSRIMSGPVRMRTAAIGTPYGEFATWLYMGAAGNVAITCWDGTIITLAGLAAGIWHPIYSIQVNTTGTTGGNFVWGS